MTGEFRPQCQRCGQVGRPGAKIRACQRCRTWWCNDCYVPGDHVGCAVGAARDSSRPPPPRLAPPKVRPQNPPRRSEPAPKKGLVETGASRRKVGLPRQGPPPRQTNATVGRAKHRANPPAPPAPLAAVNPPPPVPARSYPGMDDPPGYIETRRGFVDMERVGRPSEWYLAASAEERSRYDAQYRKTIGGLIDDIAECESMILMFAGTGRPSLYGEIDELLRARRELAGILHPFLTPASQRSLWESQRTVEGILRDLRAEADAPAGQQPLAWP